MNYTVFIEKPDDFSPKVEAAGCYCEFEDKILFVKRHPKRPQGNTWGVPGGKLEKGESPRQAVIREVKEEVGLDVDDETLEEIGKLYVRLKDFEYIFHMFRKSFSRFPNVDLLMDEHLEYEWLTISEALQLPLIAGGKDALEHYQKFTYGKRR